MTGKELISFIKDNRLEDSEVRFSEAFDNVLVFGFWGVKNGGEHDEVLYCVKEATGRTATSSIELFTLKEDLDIVKYESISSEKSINLRVKKSV